MGQDARAILGEAEKVRNPQQDYTVDFLLRTSDPQSSWKERTAAYSLIAHGKLQHPLGRPDHQIPDRRCVTGRGYALALADGDSELHQQGADVGQLSVVDEESRRVAGLELHCFDSAPKG